MNTKRFSMDECDDFSIEIIETSRWKWGIDEDHILRTPDGQHWLVTIRSSTTEGWEDAQFPVEGTRVEQREIVVKKWVKV